MSNNEPIALGGGAPIALGGGPIVLGSNTIALGPSNTTTQNSDPQNAAQGNGANGKIITKPHPNVE